MCSIIIPMCGSRRALRRLCAHLRGMFHRAVGRRFRLVLMSSKSESQSFTIVRRLQRGSPHIGVVRVTEGFKRRPTLLYKFTRTGKRFVMAVSSSLRRRPRRLPGVVGMVGRHSSISIVVTDCRKHGRGLVQGLNAGLSM